MIGNNKYNFHFIFFIYLLLLGFHCNSPATKTPKDILSVNEMKVVLWDVLTAEQLTFIGFSRNRDSLQKAEITALQTVFAIHKINKEAFYKSFEYYEAHPNQMKILIDSVTQYGSREREKKFNNRNVRVE